MESLIINGGLGRFVCAIPALEKFVTNNPDAIILTSYWTPVLWGNKKLVNNIIDVDTKDIYLKIKDTKIREIEPYYNSKFLNNKINLIQAFDEEINYTTENVIPRLYVTPAELLKARQNLFNNKKIIAFQPFGSTATQINDEVVDETGRSLNVKLTTSIIETLEKAGFQVVFFDNRQFTCFKDNFTTNALTLRESFGLIANCDYFIGVDSSGQHIARSFNKPGTTFFGSTSVINFGYTDWFMNITSENYSAMRYPPIRLSGFDYWLSNVTNSNNLIFTEEQSQLICNSIIEDIKQKTI